MAPEKNDIADKKRELAAPLEPPPATTQPPPLALPLVDGLAWSGFDRALHRVPGGPAAVFRRIGAWFAPAPAH